MFGWNVEKYFSLLFWILLKGYIFTASKETSGLVTRIKEP
jgi:hypothetical protein